MTDDADLMQTVAQSLERLEADEHDAEAWRTLAACQERLKAWPEAVNCYWAAVRLSPERADWLADLRRAADQAGDPALIETLLRRYIEITPGMEAGPQTLAGRLPCRA